jgi:hypothetical protein
MSALALRIWNARAISVEGGVHPGGAHCTRFRMPPRASEPAEPPRQIAASRPRRLHAGAVRAGTGVYTRLHACTHGHRSRGTGSPGQVGTRAFPRSLARANACVRLGTQGGEYR